MKRLPAVEFQVKGLSAEKLMNAARAAGVPLWGVRRKENRAVSLRCARKDYPFVRSLAEEKGYQVSDGRAVGLYQWGRRLLSRPGLWLGAIAGTALVIAAMGFVWQVRAENAGAYEAELRQALSEMNIHAGMRKSEVNAGRLREALEWRLPQVKWVHVKLSGCALTVRLEEGTPSPEMEAGTARADVVAAEAGILKRITAFAGTPVKKAGDFVRAGDVLIRGEERGQNGEMIPVKARGEAVARVWKSVSVRIPVKEWVSSPTGRETRRNIYCLPFFSYCGAEAPDYLTSDREESAVPLGGAWIPAWLIRERYLEAQVTEQKRNLEEVKREGARAAVLELNKTLFSDEILDKWINFSMIEGDTITVTATAEALSFIGRCRKY